MTQQHFDMTPSQKTAPGTPNDAEEIKLSMPSPEAPAWISGWRLAAIAMGLVKPHRSSISWT